MAHLSIVSRFLEHIRNQFDSASPGRPAISIAKDKDDDLVRRAAMTDAQIPFLPAEALGKVARTDDRIPAVIGTKPFSWRGDDNTGNMIHAAAARRMMSKFVEYEKPGEW